MLTPNLSTAEWLAASSVLTEWPHDMNYDQLLDAIENEHEDIVIWEKFEDDLPDDLIENIEDRRVVFLRTVKEMTEDLRNAIKAGDPMTIAEQLAAFEHQIGA